MNRDDSVEWSLNPNKEFTVRSAWKANRITLPMVQWRKIVWHKDAIPRCRFILWLFCKDIIRTRDRLKRWGKINDSSRVLCGDTVETRYHLFFQCSSSQAVWKELKRRTNQAYCCSSWDQEIHEAIQRSGGGSMAARVRKLSLGISVYCIWWERNLRIFQNSARTVERVIRE